MQSAFINIHSRQDGWLLLLYTVGYRPVSGREQRGHIKVRSFIGQQTTSTHFGVDGAKRCSD